MNSLERNRGRPPKAGMNSTSEIVSRFRPAPEPTMMVKGLAVQIKMVSGSLVSGEW